MKPLQIPACALALLLAAAAPVNAGPLDEGPYRTRPAYTPPPASTPPVELQRVLTEGQTAFMKGDTATAKTDFEWALRLDSHNKTAIGFLRRILAQEGQNKGLALEKQLDTLMIPRLDFKEATLQSALDFMKKAAEKSSNGKIAVSFVVQAPPEAGSTPVTLSLSNIPFTEALRYIGGVAGMNFTYEKYAIVVRPSGAEASPTAATAPPK